MFYSWVYIPFKSRAKPTIICDLYCMGKSVRSVLIRKSGLYGLYSVGLQKVLLIPGDQVNCIMFSWVRDCCISRIFL